MKDKTELVTKVALNILIVILLSVPNGIRVDYDDINL